MTSETYVELQNLLSALCDQEISEEEFTRLEAILGADAECRQFYLQYVDMHANLLIDSGVWNVVDSSSPTLAGEIQSGNSVPTARSRQEGILNWGRSNIRHAVLVAATLAASLLVQIFWLPPLFSDRTPEKAGLPQVARTTLPKKTYVATLIQGVNCVWESPRDAANGARLAPGKLQLPKGVASIRFDGGPELIVEGPAEITLESSSAVTVLSGKVVFRTADSDVPFDLRTPSCTLVDVATEFAVSVSAEAEEVHVFEGELQRVPKKHAGGDKPENLKAGESRRYESQTNRVEKPTIDAKQFVRYVVDPAKPVLNPNGGLLAYEGFAYTNPFSLQNGKGVGGTGWAGPWRASTVRPGPKADRERFSLNVKDSLSRPGAAARSVGGSFDYAGYAKSYRKMAQPLALDADGAYFLSFLFRRQRGFAEMSDSLAVVFWTDDDYQQQNFLDFRKRLNISVKGSNQISTHLHRMTANTSMPLTKGTTYLMVAKIAACRSKHDQVFLRVYGPDEAIESEETARWSVQSPAFRSDLVFEWIEIETNGKSRQTLDEIRLGTTWSSVTSPWIGKQKQAAKEKTT